MSTIATSEVDLWGAEALADPYPFYRQLRETAAVVCLPKYELYALSRYLFLPVFLPGIWIELAKRGEALFLRLQHLADQIFF